MLVVVIVEKVPEIVVEVVVIVAERTSQLYTHDILLSRAANVHIFLGLWELRALAVIWCQPLIAAAQIELGRLAAVSLLHIHQCLALEQA